MADWLKDKYVVLSGASGGIGRELCKILVRKYGAKVVGIGRSEEKMLSLQAELGESFRYRLFDVSVRENWAAFALWLKDEGIAPILLINNAGAFPTFARAIEAGAETAERIMRNNYFSAVYAIENVSPLLVGTEKDKPAIVNIASSAALCTVAGTGAYSASKSALKSYTEALQMEEKGRLYVGLICPGTTATELFRGDENTKNSALDKVAMPAEKMSKKIARKILRKRRRAVVGWDAKLMSFTTRLMPVKGLFLIRGVMKASGSKVFKEVFKK
ncbi:MAG: SDR family NAD(P)-dependent oxidoreductase [Clostridia bacterium]|nr:SDR family NAD(P)-dependent oxidoreductase [Clostridia bacterium]